MSKIDFQFAIVTRKLEGDSSLVEPLLFPGASCFGDEPARQESLVCDWVKKVVEGLSQDALWRYQMVQAPEVETVLVRVDPPKRNPGWADPVDLTFHVVTWEQEQGAIGFVPALGVDVIAPKADQLPKKLQAHILFTLQRQGYTQSLMNLTSFERIREVEVAMHTIPVRVRSPKAVAQELGEGEEESVLEQVTENVVFAKPAPAYEIEGPLRQLADLLSADYPSSVLLVGPAGVGKTALVLELIRRRRDFHLGHTPFFATSGSRLVAGMCGYGMWQERCAKLCQELARQGGILHLGNLPELMEAGKSTHNQRGVASFLASYLIRGDFTAIAECTPEQVAGIEREDPRALEAFTRLDIREPNDDQARSIIRQTASALPVKPQPFLDEAALEMLYRLHERYAAYSVKPGRMLRFLKNLSLDQADAGRTLNPRDLLTAFAKETGLPLFMLDDSIPLEPERVRTWFFDRVLGQPAAVEVLVNALAVIKTRMARPRKPIASLLFAGPTGVGKTETAKALARFLFGDRSRLTRIDMSEYANPTAALRLIGGAGREEGVLTAKAREQPFSVILLDEFEKAHPDVHDLLLQVLGEGRLTDAAGRKADFSNAVIILTSNLGSDSYQRGTSGFAEEGDETVQAMRHFTDAVKKFLRPELFNRLDALVPFQPLTKESILGIARRELEKVSLRDGLLLRDSGLEVTPAAQERLAELGYEPRYGARPLKRCIDGRLMPKLAEQMNQYHPKSPLSAVVDLDETLTIEVQPRLDENGKPLANQQGNTFVRKLVRDCCEQRRAIDRLLAGATLVELENECARLEQAMVRDRIKMTKGQYVNWDDNTMRKRQQRLRSALDACQAQKDQTGELEREVLLDFNEKKNLYAGPYHTRLAGLQDRFQKILADVFALGFEQPDAVGVGVFSEYPVHLFEMTRTYFQAARNLGNNKVKLHEIALWRHEKSGENRFRAVEVEKPEEELAEPRGGVIGFYLDIKGAMVFPRFATEAGLHVFKRQKRTMPCLVDISNKAAENYLPPKGVDRKGGLPASEGRRIYDIEGQSIREGRLEKTYAWPGDLVEPMTRIMADHFDAGIQSVMPS